LRSTQKRQYKPPTSSRNSGATKIANLRSAQKAPPKATHQKRYNKNRQRTEFFMAYDKHEKMENVKHQQQFKQNNIVKP
jgi:hypothetical protein